MDPTEIGPNCCWANLPLLPCAATVPKGQYDPINARQTRGCTESHFLFPEGCNCRTHVRLPRPASCSTARPCAASRTHVRLPCARPCAASRTHVRLPRPASACRRDGTAVVLRPWFDCVDRHVLICVLRSNVFNGRVQLSFQLCHRSTDTAIQSRRYKHDRYQDPYVGEGMSL